MITHRWLKNTDYRTLLRNYSSLSLVQLSNYILPLITLPYLTRVLGTSHFGLVMMAQATMVYLTLITDYGFNLSATKQIATVQTNTKEVSKQLSTVMTIKSGLLLMSAMTLYLLIQWVPLFNAHKILFFASFLIVVGNTFLPTFLFQGLEKMGTISILNLIAKLGFTGLIFLLITEKPDYMWVHALWGCSYIVVDLMAFGMILTRFKLHWVTPTLQSIQHTLVGSFEYFLSRVAIALYLNANVIIIGIVLTPTAAGLYSGAEKLLFAITTFYAPLIETVYPYVSRTKNKAFIQKILIVTASLNTIICTIVFFIAPILIPFLLGSAFAPASTYFKWLLIIAVLHLPTSMIGYPILGALGYQKTANRSVIYGAIIHIILLLLCYSFLKTPIHFIWIMIASQSVIFLIRIQKLYQIRNIISNPN